MWMVKIESNSKVTARLVMFHEKMVKSIATIVIYAFVSRTTIALGRGNV